MMLEELTCFDIKVEPNNSKEFSKLGIIYFTAFGCERVGAQCRACNNIVWVHARKHSILNEKKPENVPDSGAGWKTYRESKIQRFFASLPDCPECGSKGYDQLITNMDRGRWSNGEGFSWDKTDEDQLQPLDPRKTLVWVYEEK